MDGLANSASRAIRSFHEISTDKDWTLSALDGRILARISRRVTALVATHDPALIDIADSVLNLEDGRIAAPASTG